ncbi:MAG: sulfite oxidase [Acetobacteraceae bacterium]|nr:sulfite oxidase [Acetobacteraceae bacterium]
MGELQRRDVLAQAGVLAGAALLQAGAMPRTAAAQAGPALVVPWSDPPEPVPPALSGVIQSLTPWENLDSWITPNDRFFAIGHYGFPAIDAADWRLEIAGLIDRPASLTLDQIKALPRHEVTSTIECSGNNGLSFLTSAIGNARWAGTPLAPILRAAGVRPGAIEVVFFAADKGQEVLRKGTPLELSITSNFARSMSLDDATDPSILLCYEMNGAPLPRTHGFPVRLIAPGWYGVANVKWLRRIELSAARFMGRFMGRDYVTVREENLGGRTVVTETSVGRTRLKSAPARVTRAAGGYRIEGMAWGPLPIAAVEVRIDTAPWVKATLDGTQASAATWRSWHLDWAAAPGEHTVTTRAIDQGGNTQPAMDDPSIADKMTYWESNGQITRRISIT